jgi:signal peptidase I
VTVEAPPATDTPSTAAAAPARQGGPATDEWGIDHLPAVARPRAKTDVRKTVRELPVLFVVALTIAFLMKTFVAQAFYIPSGSMQSQLDILDRVVVSKLAYKVHAPRRGDIVVFDAPEASAPKGFERKEDPLLRRAWRFFGERVGVVSPLRDEYIKRVVGLPGDTVEGRENAVWVNGKKLVEPYLAPGTQTLDFTPRTVPEGHVFVMGDNRTNSHDSRIFGPIKQDTIVGRAIARVWPPSRAAFI